MNLTIHCPHCGQQYELDNFHEGDDAQCAACMKHFTMSLALVETNPNVRELAEQPQDTPHASQPLPLPAPPPNDSPKLPADQLSGNPAAAKPENAAYHTPILESLLSILAILETIALTLAIVGCIAAGMINEHRDSNVTSWAILLCIVGYLVPLITYGWAQMFDHIGRISHHAAIQTALLVQLRESMDARQKQKEDKP